MRHRRLKQWTLGLGTTMILCSLMTAPLDAQSDRASILLGGGAWHLHSRIPLGYDSLLLHPARRAVQILASAEVPELEGWTLTERSNKVVLLDASHKPVQLLPKSITFRVTVGTRDKFIDSNPLPIDCEKTLNDFLLDMHFQLQVFRGMEMRSLEPIRTWMIGVPADEASDERIYRSTFDLRDVRPDDRLVLLVTDGSGARVTKFHLEFL